MPQKLSDFIKQIKSINHVVESERAVSFTREFERDHKSKIVDKILDMNLGRITETNLNKCHFPGYKFKELIYATTCFAPNGPSFTKQFLFDIHIMIEKHLELTDFKIYFESYFDFGDPEVSVHFYLGERGDDEPAPDYFEYFKFVKKT